MTRSVPSILRNRGLVEGTLRVTIHPHKGEIEDSKSRSEAKKKKKRYRGWIEWLAVSHQKTHKQRKPITGNSKLVYNIK